MKNSVKVLSLFALLGGLFVAPNILGFFADPIETAANAWHDKIVKASQGRVPMSEEEEAEYRNANYIKDLNEKKAVKEKVIMHARSRVLNDSINDFVDNSGLDNDKRSLVMQKIAKKGLTPTQQALFDHVSFYTTGGVHDAAGNYRPMVAASGGDRLGVYQG